MAKDNVLQAVLEMKSLAKEGLADFRKDVKKSAADFKKEFEHLKQSVDGVEKAVQQTGKTSKGFGAIIGSVFKGMLSAVTSFATSITALGTVFRGLSSIARTVFGAIRTGISITVRAVKSMVSYIKGAVTEWLQLGDDLDSLSVRLKISTDALQEWAFIARAAGFSAQSMYKALEQMVKRVAEADEGLGVTAEALDKLGLSAEKLMHLDADEQLKIIVSALGDVEVQAKRVQYAFDIFGKSGTSLTQLLALTDDQVNKLVKNLHELGAVMSKEDIAASNALRVEIMQIEAAFKGLRHTIARVATPILKDFAVRAKGHLLTLRPTIEGIFQSIPESAKVAFNFVRDHGAWAFGQMLKAMTSTAKFGFKVIADIFIAAMDVAFATMEDHFEKKFGTIRKFLAQFGLASRTEFEKLTDDLRKLEQQRGMVMAKFEVTGFPTSMRPQIEKDEEGKLVRYMRLVNGIVEQVTIIRDKAGEAVGARIQTLDDETMKVTERVIGSFSSLEASLEDTGKKFKARMLADTATFKSEMKAILGATTKEGTSLKDILDKISAITNRHIAQQKEINEEHKKRKAFIGDEVSGFGRLVSMAQQFKAALQEKAEDVFGISEMIAKLKEWWDKIMGATSKGGKKPAEDISTFGGGLKRGIAEAGEAFSPFNRGMALAQQGINGLYGSLESFFTMAMDRSNSLKDSLKALGAQLLRLAAQMALRSGLSAVFGAALTPATPKASGGVIAGEIKQFAASAGRPIRGASRGMIAEKPELLEVGEGGRYEAIVPMEGNRFVPVKLHITGGRGSGGGGIGQFHFSPQIVIQGNADEQMVIRAQRAQEQRMVPLIKGLVREMVSGGDADTVRGIRTQAGFAL